ncbi:MAG: GspH/FimT family pseudopilin [Alteromonadaceae bacterium]|nr:GspH/FimT family pseudopilin [Alteromonadaceae bacterium]
MLSNALSQSEPTINTASGFTLIELMITIALLSIIIMIALPNLNNFTTKLRVDNEISELNRLLLIARNNAINEGVTVTLCPLVANTCSSNWQNELTVFIDRTTSQVPKLDAGERIIKVKSAIKGGDKLQYGQTFISYDAMGHATSFNIKGVNIDAGGPFLFSYCPQEDASLSRGVYVSISGRARVSTDTNGDGIDEAIDITNSSNRKVISCS